MNVVQRIADYFIGHYLNETADVYEAAKIKLTYRIFALATIAFIISSIGYLVTTTYAAAIIGGVVSLTFISLLLLLKWKKNIRLIAIILISAIYILYNISLFLMNDVPNLPTGFWIVIAILYTFFVLGKKWGSGYLVAALIPYLIYIRYGWSDNLQLFEQYTNIDYAALLVEMCLVFVMLYFIATQFSYVTKVAEEKLKQANAKLREQDEFKANLLKEIHHRVKNNFAMVVSLIRIQRREIDDEKLKSILRVCEERVHTLSLLHERMYREGDFSSLDTAIHIKQLLNELITTYSSADNVSSRIEIEDIKLGMKTAAPFGFIINELITNSLKYAFPDGRKGLITIQMRELKNGYELLFSDDGVGIQNGDKDNSVGMELINVFVQQLEGTIQKLETKGTAYKITFYSIG